MKDAVDKARGLVAGALALLLVLIALRMLVNLSFIENRLESGFGSSAAGATDFETLALAAIVGLALGLTVALDRFGNPGLARVLLAVDAGALLLIAVLALVGAVAVFASDLSGLQQFLGFLSRLAACALLLAVANGCWSVSRSPELVRASPQRPGYGYPQGGPGYGGQPFQGQGAYPPPQYGPTATATGGYAPYQQDPHQNVQSAGQSQYGQGHGLGSPAPYAQQYGHPSQQQGNGPSGSHAWTPSAASAQSPATPPGAEPFGYHQPQASGWRGEPYGAPQYGRQYGQQYSEEYGQRYGQPRQQEPQPSYGQPYAQQYAPSQYEQQHGHAQPEATPVEPYPVQGGSEQGQPVESTEPAGDGARADDQESTDGGPDRPAGS